jgi:hypothetical protein
MKKKVVPIPLKKINNYGFIPYTEFTIKSNFKSGRYLTIGKKNSIVIKKYNKALN